MLLMRRSKTPVKIAWLAGYLEGEGSFWLSRRKTGSNYPGVSVWTTDRDVLEHVVQVAGNGKVREHEPRQEHYKPTFYWELTGRKALKLMSLLHPYMGKRRKEKIHEIMWTARNSW